MKSGRWSIYISQQAYFNTYIVLVELSESIGAVITIVVNIRNTLQPGQNVSQMYLKNVNAKTVLTQFPK